MKETERNQSWKETCFASCCSKHVNSPLTVALCRWLAVEKCHHIAQFHRPVLREIHSNIPRVKLIGPLGHNLGNVATDLQLQTAALVSNSAKKKIVAELERQHTSTRDVPWISREYHLKVNYNSKREIRWWRSYLFDTRNLKARPNFVRMKIIESVAEFCALNLCAEWNHSKGEETNRKCLSDSNNNGRRESGCRAAEWNKTLGAVSAWKQLPTRLPELPGAANIFPSAAAKSVAKLGN